MLGIIFGSMFPLVTFMLNFYERTKNLSKLLTDSFRVFSAPFAFTSAILRISSR